MTVKERPSSSSYKPTPLTEEEIEARLSRAYQKAVEKQEADNIGRQESR